MSVDTRPSRPQTEVRSQVIRAVNGLYFETYVNSFKTNSPLSYNWFEGHRRGLEAVLEKITGQHPMEDLAHAIPADYNGRGTYPNKFHIGGDQYAIWDEGLPLDILQSIGDGMGKYSVLLKHGHDFDKLHPDPNLQVWRQFQEAFIIWEERQRTGLPGTAWDDFKKAGTVLRNRKELIFPE